MASPRSANVSICPPRGPGTCRRAAPLRYIPPPAPREITSFVLCQSPQILRCYCVLCPPPVAPREYRPHFPCLHATEKKEKRSTRAPVFPVQVESSFTGVYMSAGRKQPCHCLFTNFKRGKKEVVKCISNMYELWPCCHGYRRCLVGFLGDFVTFLC